MSTDTNRQELPLRELALLVLLASLWGSSYLLIKLAVATIPPITLIAVRVSLAAMFLLIVVHLQGERLPRDAATWRMLLVQACLNAIVSWTLLAWGQQHVDSGLAGVLNSTSPIWVLFITLLFTRHEVVTGRKLTGALLGMTGVVLIVGFDAWRGFGQQIVGQIAVVAAAVLYAAAAIYGKRFSSLAPSVTAASTMIWAAACLVPLSLVVDKPWTLTPSASSILAAVLLGLLCTGCALLIYFRLIRTIGSLGAASQSFLRAGLSVLLGVVVLGEQFSWGTGLGLAAIILGVAAINIPSRPASPRYRIVG